MLAHRASETQRLHGDPTPDFWLAQEVRTVLGERSGVDVRVVNGRVLLEGEVASETFKKRIEKLVVLYPDQVLNFTTFRESFVEGAKMVDALGGVAARIAEEMEGGGQEHPRECN